MTEHIRIPITLHRSHRAAIEDIDLAAHMVAAGAAHGQWQSLAARDRKGNRVTIQCLTEPEHSRRTLLFENADATELLVALAGGAAGADRPAAVRIARAPDNLDVSCDGKPFFSYRYNTNDRATPRPYFHPLIGPTGAVITQMGEVPGKRERHFHHTALWIAHQNFRAGAETCDSWQIGRPNSTRIEHVSFETLESGPLAARFTERLHWLNIKADRVLLDETRMITVPHRPPARRVIDVDLRLRARELAVTFNRTPYHMIALRVLDALLPARGGVMTNSGGMENPADGLPADWIDVSGRLNNAWIGAALMNHQGNFRHPTPCLQFARQTIGLAPTHREAFTLEPKQELRLRYRVYIHEGNAADGRVAQEYQEYVRPAEGRLGRPADATA